uniref:Cilia- and flagella-associated protein 69 ARM repeats domain-containing protein n=1 Tax=Globisporangium ultimum (strain ATCC 200006 / CBS 805.95 / DAOM BR144) TaxID=431595 RepID=K3WRH7_GLOUD
MCSKPFLRQKSNEEISNPALLHGILPTLSNLLSFDALEVQVAAAEALQQFAIGACLTRGSKPHGNNADTNTEDLRLSPRIFSQNLMEETGAVEAIVGVLYDLFPEEDNAEMIEAEAVQLSESNNNTERSTLLETERPAEAENAPMETDRPLSPSTPSTPLPSARFDSQSTTAVNDSEAVWGQDDRQQMEDRSEQNQTLDRESRMRAILFPIIDLIYEVSSNQRCAEVLVLSGALHYIVFILQGIRDAQDELLPLCIVILWNVLELCQEKMKCITKCASRRELLVQFRLRNAAYFLGNEFTCQTLLHTLELLFVHGYRKQDKEMRNECLMILHLLARRRRSLDHFYSTGLTACLLSYATAAEYHNQNKLKKQLTASSMLPFSSASAINANSHNCATNSDDDFEFKQVLWFLIAEIMGDHDANLSELVQFRFMETLLRYATVSNNSNGYENDGTLSVLNHIAPFILDHFYELRGHILLLDFLKQDTLGNCDAVEATVAAFASPPSRHTFAIRRNAIIACANMCRDHDDNRRRFYHANGVHFVTQYLEFDPSHSVLEENLLIGVVEAVRSCIVGDLNNETAFIHDNGVSKLLTIVESVPKAVKNQALAALAEICVNPSAIPSFLAWRSDSKETNNAIATQILLRIYADEEAIENSRMMEDAAAAEIVAATNARQSAFQSVTHCHSPFLVSTINSHGEIGRRDQSTSLVSPTSAAVASMRPQSPAFARLKDALKAAQNLASDTRNASLLLGLKDSESHSAINLKAKIYAVLANVSFACDLDKLTPRDQVMLEVAKEYPTFQLGEMWQNVHLALHAEGIRPIYADTLYIRRHIEHAYNISVCTKHAQKEIFSRTSEFDSAAENAFFQQILLQKHQEAQAEAFHRVNLRQNSTLKLHFDAKKTRLEFMRKQDPASFAAYESDERCRIEDPAPESDYSDLNSLEQKEAELRGRLGTITHRK